MLFGKKNKHQNKEDKLDYSALFNAGTVGMALVSGMLVGGAMGYFLDKWLGTSPWLLFIFLIFGVIAGIKNAFHFLKQAGIELESIKNKKDENADNKQSE